MSRNDYISTAILYVLDKKQRTTFTQRVVLESFIDPEGWFFISEQDTRVHLVQTGLDHMKSTGVLSVEEDTYGPDVYEIADSLDFFPDEDSNVSPESKLAKYGVSWLSEALSNIVVEFETELKPSIFGVNEINTNSQDEWEPLSIDRESDEVIAQFEKLQEQLLIIENDNGYAASEPDERNGILEPAKQLIQTMRQTTVSKTVFRAAVIKPMQYLTKKFTDSIIGVAAKRILEIALTWI